MKVVHLSTVHRVSDPRILDRECRSLAAAGHDVVLIARAAAFEPARGVEVKMLPKRKSRFWRMTLGTLDAYRAAKAEDPDVYHLHDPELLPLAWMPRRRARVVFDLHEDLPNQILDKEWIPRGLRKAISRLTRRALPILLRRCDAVITATEPIARTTLRQNVVVVQNYPRPGRSSALPSFPEREQAVAYVGGLSEVRGATQLIEAMRLLPADLNIALHLAGSFETDSLEERLRRDEGWEKVRFHGWQPFGEIERLFDRCRAGVVTFLPTPRHLRSEPNKLFQYMAAGLPVVASDFPLWRDIVAPAQAGVLVDPADPNAIEDAIEFLTTNPVEAERMGHNGMKLISDTYNWGTQETKLVALYEKFASQPNGLDAGG